jgi:hypothetical protein
MNLLLMDEDTASLLFTGTENMTARLEPRQIVAGPHAGLFILPVDVIADPAFEPFRSVLEALDVVDVDIAEAFPPEDF